MQRKFLIPTTLMFVLALLLVGCSGLFPTAQAPTTDDAPAAVQPDSSEDAMISEVETDSEEAPDDAGAMESEADSPPEDAVSTEIPTENGDTPEESAPPTDAPVTDNEVPESLQPVRQELVATPPDQVSLSSGQVHLVEFFAFW